MAVDALSFSGTYIDEHKQIHVQSLIFLQSYFMKQGLNFKILQKKIDIIIPRHEIIKFIFFAKILVLSTINSPSPLI
jgi:hypothetical protein